MRIQKASSYLVKGINRANIECLVLQMDGASVVRIAHENGDMIRVIAYWYK